MGLIEAILIGIQFKRLENPIVFLSMLAGLIFFTGFGLVIVAAGIEGFMTGKGFFPSLAISSLSILFFGLSGVCGYFIKRCVS
ncbi:MAG: hypothetical protein GY931_14900 [Maribacter sp.]|nr:hypothetical protein [Maribacter sp.]